MLIQLLNRKRIVALSKCSAHEKYMAINNHYPSTILDKSMQNRAIYLLVKNQENLGGAVDQLKTQLETTANNIVNTFKEFTDTNFPSDSARQKGIGSRTKKLQNLKTIYGVALPLPNELSDTQSHQWTTSQGFVGNKLGGMYDATGIDKMVGEVASGAGFRKPLIDPGYFQDYKGTEPREFSFSWDLVPNNVEEAENIMTILYNLKKFTLPKTTINGLSMLSPYLFDLTIGNPRINAIMNMNNVVCKSMSINYSAEGTLQFFADGIPKYMKLEMTFAERSTVTAEFY